jgi:hypothetical protein
MCSTTSGLGQDGSYCFFCPASIIYSKKNVKLWFTNIIIPLLLCPGYFLEKIFQLSRMKNLKGWGLTDTYEQNEYRRKQAQGTTQHFMAFLMIKSLIKSGRWCMIATMVERWP